MYLADLFAEIESKMDARIRELTAEVATLRGQIRTDQAKAKKAEREIECCRNSLLELGPLKVTAQLRKDEIQAAEAPAVKPSRTVTREEA